MNDDKIRVLVVDDSATMRKLLMQILQQDNEIEVVGTAMNGIFALNKLESLKPDIITLDIEMPQMDGLQFLEEKNKKNDTTPVIILSSLTTSGSSTTMRALEVRLERIITGVVSFFLFF
ncbi:MAG TPA: response regulator, partial [Exilispira sp.]|nr:response regulator [Exilispira sp.]